MGTPAWGGSRIDRREPDRLDYLVATLLGVAALAAYVGTLAPDVLYGDSAEFQALAYTLGMTHCTGYPVYLALARLAGFLPTGVPAWRVNLFSALSAAVTVANVYLLARYLTRSRIGALLGGVSLGLSYTFWSQAVIAEVYTPAMAFLSAITLLLWRWRGDPSRRTRSLFLAALLGGLSPGVHASAALIAPVAGAFVVWTLLAGRGPGVPWGRSMGAALAGLVLGVAGYLGMFLAIEVRNPPSSFEQVAFYPSRAIWGLQATDLDSPWERFRLTVSGRQWQDAMHPGDPTFLRTGLAEYGKRLASLEFPLPLLACAALGVAVALGASPGLGGFLALGFGSLLLAILSYDPPDKYVFYLPTYLQVAVAAGAGVGYLLELAHRGLAKVLGRAGEPLYLVAAVLPLLALVRPSGPARLAALRAGAATFVQEQYPYPLYDLREPRRVAALRLAVLPDDAVLIMDWRALYTTLYLAHVEQGRTGIRIMEATPHGGEGTPAATLLDELDGALEAGRPVYADQVYPGLGERYRVRPVTGTDLYRLTR